jgi:NAD(P)-dependent dehydrogenase (short-subunit alcohol dehydrogenase family)
MFDLSGKVALVTGGSSGLGVEFARTLLAAGATVVVAARRGEKLAALCDVTPGLDFVICDISNGHSLTTAVNTVIDRHSAVDILVNNAGTTSVGAAETESIDSFRSVIDLNLVGTFHITQRVAEGMLQRGRGSIINIASIYGQVAAAPNSQASYCASKGALVNLTRELSAQWARRGVRVNALAPGYFPSELTDKFLGDEKGLNFVARNTPMGRAGRLDELSGPLLLLASDAGSYITGQTLTVDGGWTAR